jgi:CheY-like chemotaxis protein/nitrogen-specific signal transduction histidine kinase
LGVSPRRQLDATYRGFLTLVADQFSSALQETRSRLDERQRAQALAELDQAKNVFFGNVSHEFRTPLTLMLGPVDNLLARRSLPPDVTESLRLVQRNGVRLRKLVNSLLDFSRIEAGRVDARFQPTDLAAFTQDLVSVFRSAIEDAGLRLFAHFARLPEPVFVDREMWEKIVLNLLSNALKYTLEGDIEVVLAVSGSEVHLGVRDTGVGIDAQELPHVFDRFHRAPGTRGRSQEGTGIGLALLRELVKLHGGEVAVISQLGKGTCFTVSIPLGSAHLPKAQVDLSATPASATIDATPFVDDALRSEGTGSSKSARGRVVASSERENILVVDDNADMRLYLERILEPYWSVTTAANGLDAIAAIERMRPDLVVTDMNMPGLNGRGLLQHIRTHSRATHTLPVIVLSAQAGDDQKVAGLNQGADDYLVKPFSTRELLARVEVQLLRSRVRGGAGLPDADSPVWLGSSSQPTNGQDGGERT